MVGGWRWELVANEFGLGADPIHAYEGARRISSSLYSLAEPPPIKHLDTRVLMIITRTPLRISIGGGGTDLPSYYRRFGGFVISAAINKHIYVSINERFSSGYLLKYSALEQASELEEIRHPLIREALRLYDVQPPIEVVSMA